VEGFGFGVGLQGVDVGFEFRAWGLGFRVWGLGSGEGQHPPPVSPPKLVGS